MTTELIYPTLKLFVYVLRKGLGQDDEQKKKNRKVFKQLLPLTETDSQEFDRLNDSLDGKPGDDFGRVKKLTRSLPWWPAETEKEVDGHECTSVNLDDTYAVLFNSSFKYPLAENLTSLKVPFEDRLKVSIPPEIRLGHTWLFSTAVSLSDPAEIEELAKQCYEKLMPDSLSWKDALVTPPGNFLGRTVFELEGKGKEHLLMMFYPALKGEAQAKDDITEVGRDFNEHWLHLFWYRHKILWAYRQGQKLKAYLENGARDISVLKDNLRNCQLPKDYLEVQQQLDKASGIFDNYAEYLVQLKSQSHTIDVNRRNYKRRLRLIVKKAGQPLTCLSQFGQQVKKLYGLQVQKDYAFFKPQLKMLKRLIDNVRVKVEVGRTKLEDEKKENERDFQRRVSFLAVALAAGAIMASISGHFPTSAYTLSPPSINTPWEWFVSKISWAWLAPGFSILISFGTAFLVGWIAKLFLDKKWVWLALTIIVLGMVFVAGWVTKTLVG